MPEYDFRCDACAHRFAVRFKTYDLVDDAALRCPACSSAALSRLIAQVAIAKPDRDYRNMSSREMLSVLESGESGPVDELFKQVAGSQGAATSSSPAADQADPA